MGAKRVIFTGQLETYLFLPSRCLSPRPSYQVKDFTDDLRVVSCKEALVTIALEPLHNTPRRLNTQNPRPAMFKWFPKLYKD